MRQRTKQVRGNRPQRGRKDCHRKVLMSSEVDVKYSTHGQIPARMEI